MLQKDFRAASFLIVSAVVFALLLVGCSPTASDAPKSSTADAPAPAAPDKDHQSCFACGGKGSITCRASGCSGGQVECPGACLKLTRGTWEHMDVAGHS